MKKQKVLLVSSSFPRWANDDITGRYMLEIAQEIAKEYETFVLAPMADGALPYEEMEGIQVYRHWQTPFGNRLAYGSGLLANLNAHKLNYLLLPFLFLFQFLAMAKIIRKHRIDIINPHWLIPQGVLAVFYAKVFNSKLKVVGTAHGSDINGLNGPVGTFLKKYVLARLDGLVVVSEQISDKVRTLGYKGPLSITSMGVDTSKFSPAQKSQPLLTELDADPVLLFVGACIETKGIRYLIEAMSQVINAYPKAKLLIAGDGNLKSEMIALIAKLEISEHVVWLGVLTHQELPRYMATADFFILPSFSEGFSVAVSEALSSQAIVIMTEGVGNAITIKKLQKPGEPEILFTIPIRSSEGLAKKVIELTQRRDELVQTRLLGRAFIQNFYDWKVIGEKYRQALNL